VKSAKLRAARYFALRGVTVKIGKIAVALVAMALVANFAVNVSAETPEQEQAAQDLRDANAASNRHRADLMKIPHVKNVTGEVDGQNEAAILVEVDDQKNIDAVTRQVPSQIEGFPVEIDEGAPKIRKGGFAVGRLDGAATPIPPTIDKNGYYHHTWLKPSAPAANPSGQP
jgi:hypothetical protein